MNLIKEVIGKPHDLWLGGNDAYSVDKERPFFWWTTAEKFTFTYWANGEPTNMGSKEHCVHIWQLTQYQWNDNVCDKSMGFICEDNPYIETGKKLKPACDALNQINNEVFLKFERLQMDNINELNTRLRNLEQMTKEEKSEIQNLQNITKSFVQDLSDQQQLAAKNLWEKLQNQGNKLNERIAESMDHINANFDEKLNVK